ncbi:MAG: hypothetical protein JWP63_5826 [Candidatus Solibacter sp.]|jgi:hypothetical protein|nr:hypothetical protein [Candidatus Solibacter sp.]
MSMLHHACHQEIQAGLHSNGGGRHLPSAIYLSVG